MTFRRRGKCGSSAIVLVSAVKKERGEEKKRTVDRDSKRFYYDLGLMCSTRR